MPGQIMGYLQLKSDVMRVRTAVADMIYISRGKAIGSCNLCTYKYDDLLLTAYFTRMVSYGHKEYCTIYRRDENWCTLYFLEWVWANSDCRFGFLVKNWSRIMLVPSIQTELSTICVSLKYSTLRENGGEFSERYLFVLSPTYKGYLLEKLFCW